MPAHTASQNSPTLTFANRPTMLKALNARARDTGCTPLLGPAKNRPGTRPTMAKCYYFCKPDPADPGIYPLCLFPPLAIRPPLFSTILVQWDARTAGHVTAVIIHPVVNIGPPKPATAKTPTFADDDIWPYLVP